MKRMMKEEGRDCTQELLFYLFLKQQEKKKKRMGQEQERTFAVGVSISALGQLVKILGA